jgi:predicted DNA-binding protein (MmcQ/YjbR family)
MMDADWLRRCCKTFPQVTEHVQWECLVLKVAGKIFAMAPLEPNRAVLSVKVPPEDFADLTETPGVFQAPYCAKGQWIALESEDTLPRAEIKRLLRQSYDLVVAKLPKKTQAALAG